MGSQTSRPPSWPLIAGALSANDLRQFAPLEFTALSQAYDLGFVDDSELASAIAAGLARSQPHDLELYLRTRAIFDRKRDIEEELRRLSLLDPPGSRPLWIVLARMILQHYSDAGQAVSMLEQLYQWCDRPEDLRPFTLYGGRESETAADQVSRLDRLLRERGV
ncbi:MAG: hypothetical protein JWM87_1456 [Candidatus Eremiobacteraeota bacterium]|nr:hypothetical protein [Candidatus Eremiobacteraeota bacterium]